MFPAGLSMLWEPVEPVRALQERFGFDGFAVVGEWVSSSLDQLWGITSHRSSRMVISSENAVVWMDTSPGGLVVKCSRVESRFAALEASARLLVDLNRRGLPIAAPIPTLDGQDRVSVDGPIGPLSVVVQPELRGEWLDTTNEQAVWAAGACLARLHQELRGYTDDRLPATSRIDISKGAIQHWLVEGDHRLAPVASARLSRLMVELPELDSEPQLVHNDYRAANILTSGVSIIGVLDFDELSIGQPVGDLAFASVYLRTLFTDWQPTPATARQLLRAGYESVRPLSSAESRWYDALVLWLGIQAIPGPVDPAGWAAAL